MLASTLFNSVNQMMKKWGGVKPIPNDESIADEFEAVNLDD
jgi:hypothetical protein